MFEDPLISEFTKVVMKGGSEALARPRASRALGAARGPPLGKPRALLPRRTWQPRLPPSPGNLWAWGGAGTRAQGHRFYRPLPPTERRGWLLSVGRRTGAPEAGGAACGLLEALHHRGPGVERRQATHRRPEALLGEEGRGRRSGPGLSAARSNVSRCHAETYLQLRT